MPRIQHKRGTSANLASVNPTPLAGELVWDSTENAIKIGDGATAWASLAYVTATPRTHAHDGGDITTGTVAYARLPVGSTTSTVCAGDDARLSNDRTPTAHASTHATGGSDALSPSDIGAAPAASPTFTGTVTVSAGTAAAPALVASGDSNTGLLWPAADTVAISTAGVERLRVDSSGRVGIGRTPNQSGSSLETAGTILGFATGNYLASVAAAVGSASAPSFTFDGTAGTGIFRPAVSNLAISTASTERVRVKSTGSVRFVPLSADPSTGNEAGDVYYNSSTNKLRVYDGTNWVDLH